jgi:hypothetical protein
MAVTKYPSTAEKGEGDERRKASTRDVEVH